MEGLYLSGSSRNGMVGRGQGQVAGCCECGNEPLGFMKHGEFLDCIGTALHGVTGSHATCFGINAICRVHDHSLAERYSNLGTRTPGGVRRHVRGT
jgi:hypothetical protein